MYTSPNILSIDYTATLKPLSIAIGANDSALISLGDYLGMLQTICSLLAIPYNTNSFESRSSLFGDFARAKILCIY